MNPIISKIEEDLNLKTTTKSAYETPRLITHGRLIDLTLQFDQPDCSGSMASNSVGECGNTG